MYNRQLTDQIFDALVTNPQKALYLVKTAPSGENSWLNLTDSHGTCAFHLASFFNRIEIVKLLCSKQVDINQVDMMKRNALHWSVVGQALDVFKFLISSTKINVALQDLAGNTFLHLMAQNNQKDGLELSFHQNINGCVKNKQNLLPWHLLSEELKQEISKSNEPLKEYLMRSTG